MLDRLARVSHAHPVRIIIASLLVAAAALAIGFTLIGNLSASGFNDPASASVLAQEEIVGATGASAVPSLVAIVDPGAPIASPEGQAAVNRVATVMKDDPDVAQVAGPSSQSPDLTSKDGSKAAVLAYFGDIDEDESQAAARRLDDELSTVPGVTVGGAWTAAAETSSIVGEDLLRAELIAFPLLFLVSLWVFRGLVAALLPPLMGALVIFGGFFFLGAGNEVFGLSVYALNLVTGLGLGLAIDYSLLIVSRYREEIAAHGATPQALANTVRTAGKSVLYSALTVGAALAALMIFPQNFLFSMGFGGMVVALVAALVAVGVLPAVMALLGVRINALAPRRWRERSVAADRVEQSGGWYRLSHFVMRRPVIVALASGAFMVMLALPAFGVKFTTTDSSVLPQSASARQVDQMLTQEFPGGDSTPIFLSARAGNTPQASRKLLEVTREIHAMPATKSVSPPRFVGDRTWQIDATSKYRALDDRTIGLVQDIQAIDDPYPTKVGGFTALFVDQRGSLAAHLPWAALIIVAVTIVALFLMTGSVVLPIKAVIMNVLTLGATLGVLVLIFQDGNLEGLLQYDSQGAVDLTQPILIGALAFGLSTDYAVFLLSRIKELRDSGGGERESVALGLQRTGRVVTAAALLFCIAMGAFATSRIVIIKELGIGTAVAVALDATIVRALLVPSLMALLGRWNWWAPGPLRRLHARIGVREGG
ncbi:MAG: MMPL family transporter [Actinobacteria bacterium]|nr:MMPL family transporter [Actinomycetota bacterium]